ncbi:MAG TPA: nucleotidyltransferase domain-containing protein [Saprospiraceae bacterium]|nr:nucleotidyltransferase domain-containing protein [Saprospiraceae bacterium]
MKFGLDNITIQKIQDVFSLFPEVEKVIIYGSRAKGNYKAGSDIDLTFKGTNLNHSVMNQIALMLDDLLLPYLFDLSVYSHIKDEGLLDHIERIGIEFYSKKKLKIV